jgi:hypothetical protein
MTSGVLHHVTLVRSDVSEKSPHIKDDTPPQLCYRGVIVDLLPHRGILCKAKERCLLVCFHAGNNEERILRHYNVCLYILRTVGSN